MENNLYNLPDKLSGIYQVLFNVNSKYCNGDNDDNFFISINIFYTYTIISVYIQFYVCIYLYIGFPPVTEYWEDADNSTRLGMLVLLQQRRPHHWEPEDGSEGGYQAELVRLVTTGFGLVLGYFREIQGSMGFLCIGYYQKGRHFYCYLNCKEDKQ